jgi:hypothetical protein
MSAVFPALFALLVFAFASWVTHVQSEARAAVTADPAVFIHIPKTGGTSVRSVFGAWLPHADHIGITALHRLWPETRRARSFAVVRNPWDRALSTYLFLRRPGLLTLQRKEMGIVPWKMFLAYLFGVRGELLFHAKFIRVRQRALRFDSFEEFALALPELKETYPFLASQSSYVTNELGEVVVDDVLRFEHLEADIAVYCQRLGVSPCALPHLRETQRPAGVAFHTNETVAAVWRVYADDIVRFGYAAHAPTPI